MPASALLTNGAKQEVLDDAVAARTYTLKLFTNDAVFDETTSTETPFTECADANYAASAITFGAAAVNASSDVEKVGDQKSFTWAASVTIWGALVVSSTGKIWVDKFAAGKTFAAGETFKYTPKVTMKQTA